MTKCCIRRKNGKVLKDICTDGMAEAMRIFESLKAKKRIPKSAQLIFECHIHWNEENHHPHSTLWTGGAR